MNTGTHLTMSLRLWRASVMEAAHVSEEDADRYVTRERIVRWYHAGEPVWMAASSLATWVTVARREERADAEAAWLRARLAGLR